MDENAKISDLTVAQFRALMLECLDADRKAIEWAKTVRDAANHYAMRHGSLPPQPWDEWYRGELSEARLSGFLG